MTGSGPNFTNDSLIDLTTNTATSDYDALQVQFERHLSQGLQILTTFCWSHSIDIASSDVAGQVPSKYVSPALNRGPSDFDVRHSVKAALTYEVGRLRQNVVSAILRRWSFESIFTARTAGPVDVTVHRLFGLDSVAARPDLVPGASLYIRDVTVPGGRRINPSAFVVPIEERQGSLGRNIFRGFPLSQFGFIGWTNVPCQRHDELSSTRGFLQCPEPSQLRGPVGRLEFLQPVRCVDPNGEYGFQWGY
jgi:hypothetical protein